MSVLAKRCARAVLKGLLATHNLGKGSLHNNISGKIVTAKDEKQQLVHQYKKVGELRDSGGRKEECSNGMKYVEVCHIVAG